MVAVSGEYAAEAEEEPMSPAGRLFHTRGFDCFVIAVVGSSEVVDVDRVKIGLQQSLLKHPRFSSVMEGDDGKGGRRRWVRTTVNLDNHIVVPGIDPDMDSPDEFVEDYVSELTRSSMDTSIPLWELHLLNVKTKNANSIGIFKIHHSIGDGTSLMSLILASTRKISDPDALPSLPKAKKSGTGRGHRTGLGGVLFGIWWVVTLLWNTLVDMVLFVMTVLFLKDTDTPIKGKPGVEFNPKRIVYREFSLDDVKLVKNATDATINDVILGMTQAGVSRYLNRKYSADGKKADGASGNNLPENIRLRANVLVNIRKSAGIEDLAEMMERNSKVKWGNQIAYVLIPFKISIPEDPLDYVRQAKAIIDMKKHSLEAIATYRIGKLLLDLFGIKVKYLSRKIRLKSFGYLKFNDALLPTVCGRADAQSSVQHHSVVFKCGRSCRGDQFLRPPADVYRSYCLRTPSRFDGAFPELCGQDDAGGERGRECDSGSSSAVRRHCGVTQPY